MPTTPRILDVARQEVDAIPELCEGYRDDLILALDAMTRDLEASTQRQRQEQTAKLVETIAGRVLQLTGRNDH